MEKALKETAENLLNDKSFLTLNGQKRKWQKLLIMFIMKQFQKELQKGTIQLLFQVKKLQFVSMMEDFILHIVNTNLFYLILDIRGIADV